MKLVVVKSNFQILLVPNYRVFRITVIYVTHYIKSSGPYPRITPNPCRFLGDHLFCF